ncbi:MAG: hypothetical protein LBR87_03820 [Synergistaceae bacterium]|jgi:hypothetical protein|nr:hypothetical protein [Synergistaceae bacterium]
MSNSTVLKALASFALALAFLAAPAYACDCEEPVIVDWKDAYDRSLREGRDPVEGFWGIYLDWQPESGAARAFRLAVVKNDYGVYPGADYIGVATCDKPGCSRGEVKLLLTSAEDPSRFEATLLVTDTDGAKGTAILKPHEGTNRPDSELDLSGLRYKDRQMTEGMLRIKGG